MKRVFLIGYMGAGKSRLGKQLAEALNSPFMDSDVQIEQKEGKNITEIFRTKGEAYFREKEAEFVRDLVEKEAFVCATGGGLPCFHNLMQELNEIGTTIYLKNSTETLVKRLQNETDKRPKLAELSPEELTEFIDKAVRERESVYTMAHFSLNENEQTTEKIRSILLNG
jgi:shikimate kinase